MSGDTQLDSVQLDLLKEYIQTIQAENKEIREAFKSEAKERDKVFRAKTDALQACITDLKMKVASLAQAHKFCQKGRTSCKGEFVEIREAVKEIHTEITAKETSCAERLEKKEVATKIDNDARDKKITGINNKMIAFSAVFTTILFLLRWFK